MAKIGLHTQTAVNIESMMIQCHIEMTLIQWYKQLNFFTQVLLYSNSLEKLFCQICFTYWTAFICIYKIP